MRPLEAREKILLLSRHVYMSGTDFSCGGSTLPVLLGGPQCAVVTRSMKNNPKPENAKLSFRPVPSDTCLS
jgi:hypothetical protein